MENRPGSPSLSPEPMSSARRREPTGARPAHRLPGPGPGRRPPDGLRRRHPARAGPARARPIAALEAVAARRRLRAARGTADATSAETLLERAELTDDQRAEPRGGLGPPGAARRPPRPREPVFKPIDTWRLLQAYRVEVGRDTDRARRRRAGAPGQQPRTSTPNPVTQPHPVTQPAPGHAAAPGDQPAPGPPAPVTNPHPAASAVRRARLGRPAAGQLARPRADAGGSPRRRGPPSRSSPSSTPASAAPLARRRSIVQRDPRCSAQLIGHARRAAEADVDAAATDDTGRRAGRRTPATAPSSPA